MPPFTFPTELPLRLAVRHILERLESDGSTPQQLAERARLILELAEGGSNPEVAVRLGLHPTCVRKWRNHWVKHQEALVAFEEKPLELKARMETNVAFQSAEAFGVGAGWNDLELGLRLRYEFWREFAPYVGVSWNGRFGKTAEIAQRHGEAPSHLSIVAGVRAWY